MHQPNILMRRIFYLFITVILASCGEKEANGIALNGEALGFADGTQIMIYEVVNNQPKVLDTFQVNGERFSGTLPNVAQAELRIMKAAGKNNNIIFFVEDEPLSAHLYMDSIASSYVTGGKENGLYRTYNTEVDKINREKAAIGKQYKQAQLEQDGIMVTELRNQNTMLTQKEQQFKQNFVKENPNSLFSLMLVSELFGKDQFTPKQVETYLAKLDPQMAEHPTVADLKRTMASKKKASVGGIAPDFQAPDPNGNMLSLSDAMGKYTIIDFWASWCRPCRMENPNVVRVYNQYHDKGLNIISVSLDKNGQKARWLKAIEDDQMDWYHVSNLKFWQDPIAKQYNVRSIPATFLLDEEGRIIDKNLRGSALQNRIAQLLD